MGVCHYAVPSCFVPSLYSLTRLLLSLLLSLILFWFSLQVSYNNKQVECSFNSPSFSLQTHHPMLHHSILYLSTNSHSFPNLYQVIRSIHISISSPHRLFIQLTNAFFFSTGNELSPEFNLPVQFTSETTSVPSRIGLPFRLCLFYFIFLINNNLWNTTLFIDSCSKLLIMNAI